MEIPEVFSVADVKVRLEQKLKEFNVKGKIEWRRACREYQNIVPQLWKNAKEFIPDEQRE